MHKKALTLAYFTVGYNVLEGIASITVGSLAGSIALVGFGLDSAVESISGGVVIWRLLKHGKIPPEEEERVEKKALSIIGASFFILAAYILFESAKKLYLHEEPEPTLFGIAIAALSLIVMPVLGYLKYSAGKKMGSRSVVADSKQTFICCLLSVALLFGLGLNYLFGLWWADPASAVVIVAFIIKEGFTTFKEKKLCSC